MRKVYLAGPISGLTFGGAQGWRDYVKGNVGPGIECVSPLRSEEYLAKLPGVISGHGRDYSHMGAASTGKGVATRNRWDASRCDVVLVNLLGATRVSIGTMIEMGWADAARRPIVLAMDPEIGVHDHMLVNELAGYIVTTLPDAIAIVNALLSEG